MQLVLPLKTICVKNRFTPGNVSSFVFVFSCDTVFVKDADVSFPKREAI